MPEIGMPGGSPERSAVTPNRPLDGRTSGRHEAGTPNKVHRSVDQASRPMSKSMVRLAFEGSVACTSPPVRFQSNHESTVPNARFGPTSTPPSVSSHSNFEAEKYG